ncbi:3-oxo-5-alpha-steroid 4-dehydrogenase-domain-containing protein [Radiomyces spectabilis]|uniref:3-oxo-5-alpha-steroid 4-dehydrogenase-domain-containing protein n=1 Tax=Radiomyces spectabilis TaxID=64574 RepID=UPI00221F2FBE|nr:3-oxo-5-alpha-steroid 4-dehydrogenase-domain-containing protein [Radiomyces spectabilis]KAI8393710.1 3-oxo-5-alpha-steroid 4-dehydrogenase-domain-containing protein [Radiomyces spectabilis]
MTWETIREWWINPHTYETAVKIYAAYSPVVLPVLLFVDAPYGKFTNKFFLDRRLPGKWAWGIMEIVSPMVYLASVYLVHPRWTASQVLPTSLWLIHYVNRSIIHPYRASSIAPIHWLTMVSALAFNALNGYTNGTSVTLHDLHWGLNTWCGVALWALGFGLNVYHDNILFKLREKKKAQDTKRYFIPHGGLFRYVSCPNYFAEALEWTGYAVTCWPSTPALTFAIATMSTLFPRAWRIHKWYKKEFPNYPKNRKAVVPFVL